jgi:hypothetical protein
MRSNDSGTSQRTPDMHRGREQTVVRPFADSRYLRDVGADEEYLHAALLERARAVVDQARATVAHSKELAWLLGAWTEQPLTSRCAWCRRYRVGDHWRDAGRTPPIPANRTTLSICDDCTEALRGSGLSL